MLRSKDSFKNLVENATDLIARFDSELRYVYCNKAVEFQLGIPVESLIGKTPLEIGKPSEQNNFIYNSLNEVLNSGKIKEVEQRIPTLEGIKYFNTRIIPEIDENGKIESLLAISRDITMHNQMEENLRTMNTRLELAMQIANLAWWEMDIATGIVTFDRRKAEMLGYQPENFNHYKDFMKLVHPEDIKRVMDIKHEHINKISDKYETEYRILHSCGEYRWFYDKGYIIKKDSKGIPLCVRGFVLDITERKQVEDSLRKSHECLLNVLDNLNSIVYVADLNSYEILFLNKYGRNIWGDVQGKICWQTFQKDQKGPCSFCTNHLLVSEDGSNTGGYHWEVQNTSNGRWYECCDQAIPWISGTLVRMEIATDITERKEWEKKIKSEQEFTSRMIEKLGVGFAAFDSDGKQNFVNIELCRMTGFTDSELLEQKPPYLYWAKEGMEDITKAFERTMQGHVGEYELIFKRKNGERFIALVSPRKVLDAEGRSIFVATVIDITNRKRAENALLESEEIFNQFMNHSPIFVLFIDENMKTVRLSKNYEKMLGLPVNELISRNINDLFPPDLAKKMVEVDQRVLKEGTSYQVEEELNGRIYSSIKFPVYRTGKPTYIAGFAMDITESKKSEEMRLKLQRLESIGTLAGRIAHEFNNLFSVIFGFIEIAKEEARDDIVHNYLSKAMNGIGKARDLTGQLLTFAKGGAPIRKVQHLIPFLEESIQSILDGSDFLCRFNISENIPLCNYDENQLYQVVNSIIKNAIESMPAKNVIEVTVKSSILKSGNNAENSENRYVVISIKDYGAGIPNDILPKIFDPLFTTKQNNRGLGLSICYSIISRHEGWIQVESEIGRGSTFHIFLPAFDEAPTEKPIIQKIKTGNGRRILIMDDDGMMLDLMSTLFNRLGYSVKCVKNGKEALEAFFEENNESVPFSAAFLDLIIPGEMGGKEVVSEIRKKNKDIPLFAASGYSDDPVIISPSDYGFTGSISKPFTKRELLDLFKRHNID